MLKLTVAVMTYNRADYLAAMIDSILAQSFSDFVVKIYDNGSTDKTEQVVSRYFGDERITYHKNLVNIGAGNNFNKAIIECETEFLLLTHDDDFLKPEFIKREFEILDSDKSIILVCTKTDVINAKGDYIQGSPYPVSANLNQDIVLHKHEFLQYYLNGENIISCPTVMFRKSFLIENNILFRTDIGKSGDTYLWFELNMLDGKIYYIDTPLYNYRVHNEQDSVNSIYMVPMLKSPVYDILVKNIFSSKDIREWIKFSNKCIWTELAKKKYGKNVFGILKPCIFLKTDGDLYFRFTIWLYFNFYPIYFLGYKFYRLARFIYRAARKIK